MLSENLSVLHEQITKIELFNSKNSRKLSKSRLLIDELKRLYEFERNDPTGNGEFASEFNLKAFSRRKNLPTEVRARNALRVALVRKNISTLAIPGFESTNLALKSQKKALIDQARLLQSRITEQACENADQSTQIREAVAQGFLEPDEMQWLIDETSTQQETLPGIIQPDAKFTPNLDLLMPNMTLDGTKYREFLASPQMIYMVGCLNRYLGEIGLDQARVDNGLIRQVNGYVFQSIVEQEVKSLIVHKATRPFIQVMSDQVLALWRLAYPERRFFNDYGGLGQGIEGLTIPDGLILYPNQATTIAMFVALYEISLIENPEAQPGKSTQFEAIKNGLVERDLEKILDFKKRKQLDPEYEDLVREQLGRKMVEGKNIVVRPSECFDHIYITARKRNGRARERKKDNITFIESSLYHDDIRKFNKALWDDLVFQYGLIGEITFEAFIKLTKKVYKY